MRLKLDFLIVCLILAILMFSAVSASDELSDDGIGDAPQDIVSLDTDDQCSAGDDVVLKDASGTFADLDNDIRSQTGSYITINRNYTYASSDGSTYRGITIDRSNIVIDGKGNTLNGNNQSIFFIVSPSALILLMVTTAVLMTVPVSTGKVMRDCCLIPHLTAAMELQIV